MTAIAELLDPRAVDGLAAVRAALAEQDRAAAEGDAPVSERRPVPPVIFRAAP